MGFESLDCYLGRRSQCGSHSILDHPCRNRSHELGHYKTYCKTGVKVCMVKRFSEFNPELGRLVVLLERKKSTSEHLLSPQSWSCTQDVAETGSAWKRTKSDLSQDLQVACRI